MVEEQYPMVFVRFSFHKNLWRVMSVENILLVREYQSDMLVGKEGLCKVFIAGFEI